MSGQRRARMVCALISGGVESAALLHLLLERGNEVHPVYIRGGFKWEAVERRWLRRLLEALSGPRLKPLTTLRAPARELCGRDFWGFTGRRVPGARSGDASVYLPGRNILLLSTASVFCAGRGIEVMAMGTLKGNPFDDASSAFFKSMEKALSLGFGRNVRVETPFRRMTKRQVLLGARGLPWNLTFSCLSPIAGKHCGRCNKCEERRAAVS